MHLFRKLQLAKAATDFVNSEAVNIWQGVSHLDRQVLCTKGNHDFDWWEGPAGLVGLNGCSHGILQRGNREVYQLLGRLIFTFC